MIQTAENTIAGIMGGVEELREISAAVIDIQGVKSQIAFAAGIPKVNCVG